MEPNDPEDRVFEGLRIQAARTALRDRLLWAYIVFLATNRFIKGDPHSYNNSMEYLYGEILKRLVAEGRYQADAADGYFVRTPLVPS